MKNATTSNKRTYWSDCWVQSYLCSGIGISEHHDVFSTSSLIYHCEEQGQWNTGCMSFLFLSLWVQWVAEMKVAQFVETLLLQSKKALQVYVNINNAIRQRPRWPCHAKIVPLFTSNNCCFPAAVVRRGKWDKAMLAFFLYHWCQDTLCQEDTFYKTHQTHATFPNFVTQSCDWGSSSGISPIKTYRLQTQKWTFKRRCLHCSIIYNANDMPGFALHFGHMALFLGIGGGTSTPLHTTTAFLGILYPSHSQC